MSAADATLVVDKSTPSAIAVGTLRLRVIMDFFILTPFKKQDFLLTYRFSDRFCCPLDDFIVPLNELNEIDQSCRFLA
jgi:hypothetical protein